MPLHRWIVPGIVAIVAALIALPFSSIAQPKKAAKSAADTRNEPPVLIEPPETPEELLNAALLMQQLSRPNLSHKYLKQLLAKTPDDATLLKLHDKFGPAKFLQLARIPSDRAKITGGVGAAPSLKLGAFENPGKELLNRVNAAVRKRASSPQHIKTLVDNLTAGGEERAAALTMLRNIGPATLPRIFERVPNANASERAALQTAMIDFGQPTVPVAIAGLQSSNTQIQSTAASTLGYLGNPAVAPYLWYLAAYRETPDGVRTAARTALARLLETSETKITRVAPSSVVKQLRDLAVQHFRRELHWQVGSDKKVELWYWDEGSKQIKRKKTTPRFASVYTGTRFARMALNLSPENEKTQALYVAMSLSAAADPSWQKPLPTGKDTAFNAALQAGRETTLEALSLSLKYGDPNAAIGTLLALRQLAKKSDLTGSNSPIVQALNYPDARVQFAAAATVLTIDPEKRFRGATRVIDILARALNDAGSPTSLVVNASVSKATSLAGLMTQMGYDPQVARTGREAYRLAASRGDIELILLQANTIRWPLSQTLANLRAGARTKGIPIAIYGPEGLRRRMAHHLRRYSRVEYIAESTTGEHLQMQLRPFLTALQTPSLTPQQRAEQRQAAAYWLAQIATGQRAKLYDLRSAESALVASISDPNLTEDVVRALAAIPTKRSQTAIHSAVTNINAKPAIRAAAATQLATHIQKYGLLLSMTQINQVKQLQMTTGDPDLATAVASVLGSLKPDAKRVGKNLQSIPLPKVEK